MSQIIGFFPLLNNVQKYISENYAASLSDKDKYGQLRTYIDKYLYDHDYMVEGMSFKQLSDKLYCEMAEYSILTKFLGREDIEEIVKVAIENGIEIIPIPGACAFVNALIASGLSSKEFSFIGFLSAIKKEKTTSLRKYIYLISK